MKQTAWTKFLNWVLVTLGFATTVSCQMYGTLKPMYGTPYPDPVMYGQPYMSYEVSGKVVDEEMKPIEGIQVVGVENDTTYTAADGSFFISAKEWSSPEAIFEDIDGPENGGEFKTRHEYFPGIEMRQVEKGSGWYRGKYVGKDVVVTLKKKED